MCITRSTANDARGAFDGALACAHHYGMNLASIRNARGLSQRDLAEMIDMDQATIQRAEKAHPSAKLATYQLCADALGVTLADIFSDERTLLEVRLIDAYRKIPEKKRDRVLAILDLVREEDPERDPEIE